MIRNFARRLCALPLITLSIAILIVSIASVPLAQMTGAGQSSGKPHTVSMPMGVESPRRVPTIGLNEKVFGSPVLVPEDPVFLPAVTYESGGSEPGSLVVADVNGDRKPDLLVANRSSGTIAVLLGKGDGTFFPAKIYDSGSSAAGPLTVTDVNGDGKPDLIVADASPIEGSVGVLLGNGDGTFQAAVNYDSGGFGIGFLTVTDVNGDKKPDLIVTIAYPNEGSVSVLLGNGDGTFQAAVNYRSGGYGAGALTVKDVNGDGKPDLIVTIAPLSNDGSVGVLLGNGDGTFQAAANYDSGANSPLSLTVEDVNADGRLDVLVANHNGGANCPGEGVLGVMLGNGDGSFQPTARYCSGGWVAQSMAVADLNTDGKQDVVIMDGCAKYCEAGDDTNIGVLLGNGDGTFLPAQVYSGGFEPASMVVADVNGDGKLDLVVVASGSNTVSVLPGNGDGTFLPAVLHNSGGVFSSSMVLEDLNGDRKPDVVVANKKSGTLAVLLHIKKLPVPSRTVLITSGSPSFVGQPVTFTATVTSRFGNIPDGEQVTFYDGTTTMGSVALASGVASYTTSSLAAKSHFIKAIYGGDPIFKTSSRHLWQVVNK